MGEARRRRAAPPPAPVSAVAAKDIRDGVWMLTAPPGEPGMLFALNASEAASGDDRAWFEANRGRSHRVRPRVAGEWPDKLGDAFGYTAVRQVRRGHRLRLPFAAEGQVATGEAAAAATFRLLVEQAEASAGRPLPAFRELPAMVAA